MTDSAVGVEMLDIFDDMGRHLGVKPRDQVHLAGDWHRVFHCQITTVRNDIPTSYCNADPNSKPLSQGCWISALQVTSPRVSYRLMEYGELEEELGVVADPNDLVLLGERRLVDDSGEGQLNKELTSVYLLRDDRPLDEYVLQTSEVDAVFEALVSELLQLFAGKLETIQLSGVQHAGSPDAYPVSISAKLEDFVPGDSYWVNLFVMCERFLNGQQPLAI